MNLYFSALEAGKSKIIAPADLVSGENLLSQWLSSHCNLTHQKETAGSLGSLL